MIKMNYYDGIHLILKVIGIIIVISIQKLKTRKVYSSHCKYNTFSK